MADDPSARAREAHRKRTLAGYLAGPVSELRPDEAADVGEWLVRRAGMPPPAFTTIRAEADAWATFASLTELRLYLAAIWAALPAAERRQALEALRRSA